MEQRALGRHAGLPLRFTRLGQFVLLRPQIVFGPIDSTRLSRPAWHKLRLCCTRLFAARAIYRSICVTSPTNFFLAPLSNARLAPPARLQLRRSYVRPMAARIVYRSICVTSPTNWLLRPEVAPLGFAPNSAALGIMQVNLPSALACTNFHHVWFVGRLLLRPEVAPLTTLGVAELATLALSVYS